MRNLKTKFEIILRPSHFESTQQMKHTMSLCRRTYLFYQIVGEHFNSMIFTGRFLNLYSPSHFLRSKTFADYFPRVKLFYGYLPKGILIQSLNLYNYLIRFYFFFVPNQRFLLRIAHADEKCFAVHFILQFSQG